MAAGLAQHRERDLEARPAHDPLLDRLLDAEVGAAGVADGRDADPNRRVEVPDRVVEAVRERRLQVPPDVDVAEHHVDVRVEEARQERRAGDVDLLVAVQPDADLGDQPVVDRDVGLGDRRAGSVEDPSAGEYRPHLGSFRSLVRREEPIAAASMRPVEGQYVAYTFYRVDPAWRRLPPSTSARRRRRSSREVVDSFAERFEHLRAYTTHRASGPRPTSSSGRSRERYDDLGELGAALNGTALAGWLETPYSYLATTKASQYTSARKARKITPHGLPYLVVYPFVKVRPWYALTEDERQRAMDEHIRIGREEFPGIKNHTTYSFGIDDQEFMTAFECEEPADFMHLMLRLRDSEASRYTERDTPIFVGRFVPVREALAALDGASARVEA